MWNSEDHLVNIKNARILDTVKVDVAKNEWSSVVNVSRIGRSNDYFIIKNILDRVRLGRLVNEYEPVVNTLSSGRSIS